MLLPGFTDPVLAGQSVFRTVMEAMARPGRIAQIAATVTPPGPMGLAAAAVALTLLDYETPVWLDPPLAAAPEVSGWLTFHTGARRVDASARAAFAFIADAARMPGFAAFESGTIEYPDRSATLVVEVGRLTEADGFCLAGPGIKETHTLSAAPLPIDFADRMAANRALFPRGVDLILTCGATLVGLPRSVRLASAAQQARKRA